MLQDNDWEFILDTINNEKCILLIGPEVCLSETGKQYDQALLDFLNVNESENILSYYDRDGLFLFRDGIAKTRSYYKIKDFFKQEFKDTIYSKLTEIPFHLIISTTPDHNLSRVFESRKIPHQFAYYDKTINPEDVETPDKNSPLLYNLFGSIDKEESMILTHDDLFDFLLALLGNRNLPGELKNALVTADNFIFLGFKFDKWYVQLLLRLLNLHNEKYKFARFASNKEIKEETQSLIIDQFRIEFVDDQIEQFVDILHQKCNNNGMLRDLEASDVSTSELVEKYIEEDLLEKAFALLKDCFEKKNEEDLGDDLTLLMSRHKRLNRKQTQGIIDEKEANIESNKIKVAVLELNKEVKLLE
jgi:hypothetical protein